jgi:hypothetical protein
LEFVTLFEDEMQRFVDINQLFLACADTSVTPDQLLEKLDGFVGYASKMHLDQIKSAVEEIIATGQKRVEHPYARVPVGTKYFSTGRGDTVVSFEEPKDRRKE